jgi:glutamate synthase (NADPH/NADH) small chain
MTKPTEKKAKPSQKKPIQKTRTPMPEQDPEQRSKNFDEVPLGYSPDQARREASRCLVCKKPACVTGCPVNVDIPGFVELVAQGEFAAAARKIKQTNALPAICGRVCPQETQCEVKCGLGKKYEPLAVGRLERFVADYERENDLIELPEKQPPTGKRVAAIGSGPSGLTVAGDLVLLGYDVTIFEAFHKPGGVLMYGIPEFRLPKEIVEKEVDYLVQLGAKLKLNQVVGQTTTVDELLGEAGFDAVFIGVGAGLPMFLGIPGEDLGGVYSANEYLTRSNLMKAYLFPEYDTPVVRGHHVCVIGGGNVAMDSARTALRLGAETVQIVYRRSRNELPARAEEIHHAEEEGIIFQLLTNPVAFEGDRRGMIRQMKCLRMELGEPDDSGRRRPVPIEGSELTIDTDLVIVAIGAGANPLLTKTTPGLSLNRRGYIQADEHGRTSKERVWSGGDIVTGSATVIEAMGAGRIAARDIHQYLSGDGRARPWTQAAAGMD